MITRDGVLGTMERMEKGITNLEALEREARDFVGALVPNKERATLVTLSGELGAGKTAFTQAVARALGIVEPVTSPTFVILKTYPLPSGQPFTRLVHVDAYRLHHETNLVPIGLVEALNDPKNLVVLEWPENIRPGILCPTHSIALSVLKDTSRLIHYG